MPKPARIKLLPQDLREALHQELINRGFSQYYEIEEWLAHRMEERGIKFTISKSTISSYGREFQEKLERIQLVTEQASAIVRACKDDEDMLADALTRLAQQKAFEALLTMEESEGKLSLDKLGTMISSLNRASIAVKKYRLDVQAKAQAAADEVASAVREKGLSDETAAQIRAKILGIAQ